ncbi:hypothetical protein GGR66_002284 [Xanthomonas sp. 3498]|nr:hypothetical protein [Xanthomonas sp. 3498]
MAFLPPTVVCAVGIRIAERLLQRRSPRQVLAWGFGAGALGIAGATVALPHGAGYWPLLPGILMLSVGQGMSWTAMWVVAGQGVPAPQQGVASGMAATAQQIGGAVGLAVLVMVANVARGAQLAASAAALDGLARAQYGAALFAVLGVVIALCLRYPRGACGAAPCLSREAWEIAGLASASAYSNASNCGCKALKIRASRCAQASWPAASAIRSWRISSSTCGRPRPSPCTGTA